MAKLPPSVIVSSGIPLTTGGSLTPVTLNQAASESLRPPVSLAWNVIVSAPVQFTSGTVIFARRFASIATIRSVLPLYVHVISSSRSSASTT